MAEWDDKTRQEDRTLHFFLQGMKTLWELLGGEKKNILITLGLMVVVSVMELCFPLTIKLIFDELPRILGKEKIGAYILTLVGAMFLLRIATFYVNRFFKEIRFLKTLIRLENHWPVMAQHQLLALSLGYHERENTGKKISKINKGCERLTDIVGNLYWGFFPQFFYLLVNLVFIFAMDWRLGMLFLAPFIPATLLNVRIFKKFGPEWEKWEIKKEKAVGLFCQSLLNVQTVQAYVQENRERDRLKTVRQDMEILDTGIAVRMQKYFFAMSFILNMFFTLTIVAGIYFVYSGTSTVGTVVYILATGNVTIMCLWEIVHVYTRVLRNLVSVMRMKELMDEEIDVKNSDDAVVPDEYEGVFSFRDVSFVYPNKDLAVFAGLNFTLQPSQMLALVGKSGEGKTTIVRLLCRMYDAQFGEITLDGRDIRGLDLLWYRRLFAIVQQDVEIFDATLKENIAYSFPDASEEDIEAAVVAAHLADLAHDRARFPGGLSTQVGERGVRLSGGEKQRVGIARAYLALLKGARVLILDEATSNLDSEAERAIQRMINSLRKRRAIAIVAIAHRLSTIRQADEILVVSDGKIIEQGSHSRLVGENGLYSHLVELQKLGEVV